MTSRLLIALTTLLVWGCQTEIDLPSNDAGRAADARPDPAAGLPVLGPEMSVAEPGTLSVRNVELACGPDTCLVAWTHNRDRTRTVGAIRIRAADGEPIDAAPFELYDAYWPDHGSDGSAVAVVWHLDRFVVAAYDVTFEIASSGGTPVALPLLRDFDVEDTVGSVSGAVSVDGWLVVVRVRRDLDRTYVSRGRSASELAPAWAIDGELVQVAATSQHVGAVGSLGDGSDGVVVFAPDGPPIHELRIHALIPIIGAVTDAFLLPCPSSGGGCLLRIDAAGIDVADRDLQLGLSYDRLIGHAGGFFHLRVGSGTAADYHCDFAFCSFISGERLDLGGLPLPEAFPAREVLLPQTNNATAPTLVALGPDRFLLAYGKGGGAIFWRTLQYPPSEDLR